MSQQEDTVAGAKGARKRQDSRRRLLAAARQLFVERGYHATRPQDISRLAGLGHGTFYLHFRDKQECFAAFMEEARAELDAAVIARAAATHSLPEMVEAMLSAIYDYAEKNPGVLVTAMTDETVIATAPGAGAGPTLVQRWGQGWAELLAAQARDGHVAADFDFAIIGQAIVGAIQQASGYVADTSGSRANLVKNLTQFFVRALTPRK